MYVKAENRMVTVYGEISNFYYCMDTAYWLFLLFLHTLKLNFSLF